MAWSSITDAYKIQNFNSEQGRRFYNYKMAEPRGETYNIMEGFIEGLDNETGDNNNNLPETNPLAEYNADVNNYISNIGATPGIYTNIFVDRNDNSNGTETRKCVPFTRPVVAKPYMSGLWVPGKVPVARSVDMDSGNQTVYMIQDDGYTKMVQWPSKISKYYFGSIDLFKESNWKNYNTAPEGKYVLTINDYYTSHNEAITACKSIASNKSPRHTAYGINAYRTDIGNSFKYECTTGRTKGDLYSNSNTNNIISKNNKTLYKFVQPYSAPIRTKFVRSPTSQNYAQHKETCRNSNGKWIMASITSNEDHTAINEVRRLNGGLRGNWTFIGGSRITPNSPDWKWEDGSPWNKDIAESEHFRLSRKSPVKGSIEGCGWGGGEPNNSGGESALMLWDSGLWNDIPESAILYAIYKEVVNSDKFKINYAASFDNDGTLSFDVTSNVYGDIQTTNIPAVKTTDNITLPLPIAGCSPLTGGQLDKQSINLKYRYNCNI